MLIILGGRGEKEQKEEGRLGGEIKKEVKEVYNLHIMLNFTRLVPFTFK